MALLGLELDFGSVILNVPTLGGRLPYLLAVYPCMSYAFSLHSIHRSHPTRSRPRSLMPYIKENFRICAPLLHGFRTLGTLRASSPTQQSRTLYTSRKKSSMPTISLRSCSSCYGLSGYGVCIGLHNDCLDDLLLFRIEDLGEIIIELGLLLLQFLRQACQ